MLERNVQPSRDDASLRKLFRRILESKIHGIYFEPSLSKRESHRILTRDINKFILGAAERHYAESAEQEIAVLKKAADILRRKTLSFMKENPVSFMGTMTGNTRKCPEELSTFCS